MTQPQKARRKTYNKALESIHAYFKVKKSGGPAGKQASEVKKVLPKKGPIEPSRSSLRRLPQQRRALVDAMITVVGSPYVPFNDTVPGPSNDAMPGPRNPPVPVPSNNTEPVSSDTPYYSCQSSPATSYATARQSVGPISITREQDNVSIKQDQYIDVDDSDYFGINSSKWSPSTYHALPHNPGSKSPSAPTPPTANLLITYAKAVVDLNLHRLQGDDCRIGTSFSNAIMNDYDTKVRMPGSDLDQLCLAWSFLRYLSGENRAPFASLQYRRLEARFVPSVAAAEQHYSTCAVSARKCLIGRAKRWLESMWWEDMKQVVLSDAVVEPIMPGDLNWIYRYISITLMTRNLWVWKDVRLEVFSHIPIWAMVYYALRCGRTEDILHYVKIHPDWFESCSCIIACFEEYLDNRPLSEHNQRWIEREELTCHENRGDPFKWMVFQLIARKCTPIPGGSAIIKNSYDNLWTHLNMVHEDPTSSKTPDYTLEAIQRTVRFYPNSDENLLDAFNMNMMTFQFERAVHLLYENQETRLHAIHFAIALMYYGLLRIPDRPSEHLLVEEPIGHATWDMKTMLDRYLQEPVTEGFLTTFQELNPHYAIHYLSVLTLYSRINDYRNDDTIPLARLAIRPLLATIENESRLSEGLQYHTEETVRRLLMLEPGNISF